MESDDKPRTIRMPEWLWNELDRDAVRCKRSAVKQLEAILEAYYRGDSAGLDTEKISGMGGKSPTGTLKLDTSKDKRKTG